MARHDPKRTGTSDGTSDIRQPQIFWKIYLGGALAGRSLLAADVDNDGESEIVLVSGGRVLVARISGQEVWTSAPRGLSELIAVTDVDGDGALEIIARSMEQVFLFSSGTGAMLWEEPAGEMGTIGTTRIADLDGDGLDELVVMECGCCGVRSENPGFVYTFKDGVAAPVRLWSLPRADCGAFNSLAVLEADGTPGAEILLGTVSALTIYNGEDGALIGQSDPIVGWMHRTECQPVALDSDPADELICLHSFRSVASGTTNRSIFALDLQPTASPSLRLLWRDEFSAFDGGELQFFGDARDLDGDGAVEVVVASLEPAGVWTTHILDASDGAILSSIPGQTSKFTAPARDGAELVLTSDGDFLRAWRFARASPTRVTPAWVLQNREPVVSWSISRFQKSHLARFPVFADVAPNSDGTNGAWPELVVRAQTDSMFIDALEISSSSATTLAHYQPGSDLSISSTWPVEDIAGRFLLAAARNDGILVPLTRNLTPAAGADDASPAQIAFGGYYASGAWRRFANGPRTGLLEPGEAESVIVTNSQGTLLALDASQASFAAAPTIRWSHPRSFAPTLIGAGATQGPTVACFRVSDASSSPPTYAMDLLDASGATLWSSPIPELPLNDINSGHFDEDDVPDLVYQWGRFGNTLLETRAVSGATGATLWDAIGVEPGAGRQPAGISVGRWDGDEFDDILHQALGTRVIAGDSGIEVHRTPGNSYYMITMADIDDDIADELILHGSVWPARTYDDDATTTLWLGDSAAKPVPYGSVVNCGGTQYLIHGSVARAARLTSVKLNGTDAGSTTIAVLAGGALYPDEGAALASGASVAQLTSVFAHSNLSGTNEPIISVGSNTGWLYGYAPCSQQLAFAKEFNAAVGAIAFGDTDNDGRDEMLVSVADGHLYNLRNFGLEPPGRVWDTDAPAGIFDRDVQFVTNRTILSAVWTTVAGATSYEIAAVDDQGAYLTQPPWIDAGNTLSTSLSALTLEPDTVYRFAVRARAGAIRSPDTVSNGVRLRTPSAVDAGVPTADAAEQRVRPQRGCGCTSDRGQRGGLELLLLLTVACLIACTRRRRGNCLVQEP